MKLLTDFNPELSGYDSLTLPAVPPDAHMLFPITCTLWQDFWVAMANKFFLYIYLSLGYSTTCIPISLKCVTALEVNSLFVIVQEM